MADATNTEWNEQARPFTNLLEFLDAEGNPLPKDGIASDEEVAPFSHFDTFDGVVEEYRRNHPKDGQLTKVQVNFATGEVSIFKKMNAAQMGQDRRGRQWESKRFDLKRSNDTPRALGFAFR